MLRALLLLLAFAASLLAQGDPFDVYGLLQLARIGDPQISPDGRMVAFTSQRVDLGANRTSTHIYVVPIGGGVPERITWSGNVNVRPRWSPDSEHIAFISDRGNSAQIWIMDSGGSGARQVTDLATEAGGLIFSPDGERILFTSEVYPECPDEACNERRLQAEETSAVKAREYTSLLYRHWNQWQSARRRHLMVVNLSDGSVTDLTPDGRDVPPFSLGGPDDYAISPDGQQVCYVLKPDPVAATSTNSDLFVVPIDGGEVMKITVNPGADNSPLYSPDGKYIAYRTQLRANYESDLWRLVVFNRATGQLKSLTEGLDRSVGSFNWSPDSSQLFFTMEDRGRQNVQMISVQGGAAHAIISGAAQPDDIQISRDGRTMIYTEHSGTSPVEIYRASSTGGVSEALTHLNDALLEQYELPPVEEFWVDGAGGTPVHSFMIKPYGFQTDGLHPVLFLIHGGPQGAWGHNWSYRWNAQIFAAAGYIVVMPNPRGSTGYGQKFTDDINADWGGKVYEDIMNVVEHVASLQYVDDQRMAAAGGSYGGYMADWMLGHTQRFKALVSHAGVYDLPSMFGETEELWFPLWEFGGAPWEKPEIYARWSPSQYVSEFQTPTLVIHGELDYRVPVGQGMQLFTALQLREVPSKLLLFPDEGHWISKPQNSELWYNTFLDWINTWVNRPAEPRN